MAAAALQRTHVRSPRGPSRGLLLLDRRAVQRTVGHRWESRAPFSVNMRDMNLNVIAVISLGLIRSIPGLFCSGQGAGPAGPALVGHHPRARRWARQAQPMPHAIAMPPAIDEEAILTNRCSSKPCCSGRSDKTKLTPIACSDRRAALRPWSTAAMRTPKRGSSTGMLAAARGRRKHRTVCGRHHRGTIPGCPA